MCELQAVLVAITRKELEEVPRTLPVAMERSTAVQNASTVSPSGLAPAPGLRAVGVCRAGAGTTLSTVNSFSSWERLKDRLPLLTFSRKQPHGGDSVCAVACIWDVTATYTKQSTRTDWGKEHA